ncbi:MAG: hypothetical protein V3V31_04120 [Methylococcales bacterium]
MSKPIYIEDQIKNRMAIFMENDKSGSLDELAQTVVTILIVLVFFIFGVSW